MDHRKQRNLQGLLRLAVEHSQSEDAEKQPEGTQMDEQAKMFLQGALKDMTVDVNQEFQIAISILENSSSIPQDILNAFSVIRDYIDNIDYANTFANVGGINAIVKYLKCDEIEIRLNAINVIAEMSQNNPFCQKKFLQAGVLTLLVPYFNENEDIASSSLYAVSSLIRNFEPGLMEFLRIDGINSAILCLHSSNTKVFVKASFLIASLSSEHSHVKDKFAQNSTVETLFSKIDHLDGFDMKLEAVLFALSKLSASDQWNRSLDITRNKTLLENIIHLNSKYAECEDMVSYAEITLRNLDESPLKTNT